MDRQSEPRHNVVITPLPPDRMKHQVRLESEQVSCLFNALERLTQDDASDFDIEQFREDLQDACWLADWKREYVLLDGEQMFIPKLDGLLLTGR